MKTTCILLAFLLAALLSIAPVSASNLDRQVLGLYKSSEGQTDKENEILFYLSGPLREMGLSVTYWDIDRGLPDEKIMRRVRAVISWYRGPSMNNPDAYLDFLEDSIDSGRKLVVFDNLGAYQDRKTGEYLQPGRLNLTLAKLGIMYFSDWTGDPELIQIVAKDNAMVEAGSRQDPALSQLFYRYIHHDRSLKVYLSLARKDRGYDPSPVIVSNCNGEIGRASWRERG